MPEKILMIALSPTMESGTLARWRKKEGDTVASGDVLCEVETDKATMDYESTAEGTLLKILLPEGGHAKVGDTIAIVGKPGDDISGLLAEGSSAPAPSTLSAFQPYWNS
jgi:pyruvate dehydrogenase E2 component (dihydrolipoamide acetyltransferase)